MAEVIRLDHYRQRAAAHRNPSSEDPTPPSTDATPVFFDRRELNGIFSLYGRMVAVNEWRDYAIDTDRWGVEFQVYRNSWDFPAYRLVKRDADAGARRFALLSGCETLIEDDRLQPILTWLERHPGGRVATFPRLRTHQRFART